MGRYTHGGRCCYFCRETLDPTKIWFHGKGLVGPQRLLLAMRYAGYPGLARLNFNFASVGPLIQLPEMEVGV